MSFSSGVIGVDFGTVNCVISQAKRGGIDTVLNEASKRKTHCYVSFQGGQRFIGASAVPLSKSNYKNTVRYVKRVIGRSWDDPQAQEEIKLCPNSDKYVTLENGDIGVKVNYCDEEVVFSCEQITAMMLNQLRRTANKVHPADDVVISVPGWWNEKQRRAMLSACKIAGFAPLSLINDHTAAALSYGIYKSARNVFDPQNKQVVMFIDVGYSNMSVAIVGFVQGKLEVISAAYDSNLGGRDFDKAVFEKFADEFKAKHNLDLKTNPKSVLKLLDACEKAKQTLTPEGVNIAKITVEFLMNEIDFRSELKLDDFEAMSEPLLQRMKTPIDRALELAKMKPEDISSVEIVGGGTRPKIVKKALATYMNLDLSASNYGLSTTLNLDEAVARGCALNSAMLSANFKVKEFNVHDVVNVPVTLVWEQNDTFENDDDQEGDEGVMGGKSNSVTLLQTSQLTPCTKRVTFRRDKDFEICAKYEVADDAQEQDYHLPNNFDCQLSSFIVKVDGVSKPKGVVDEKTPLIRVDFSLDRNGVFRLVSAESLFELQPEPEPKETKKAAPEETKDSEEQKEGEENSDKKAEEKEDSDEKDKTDEGKSPENEKNENKMDVDEKEKKKTVKKRYKKVKLQVVSKYKYDLSKDNLKNYAGLEAKYGAQDRKIEETAEAKNELEAWIYSYRDKKDLSLKDFLTPEESENFGNELTKQENWLYDEGYDETKEEYQKRLNDLKLLGDRFDARQSEWETRPKAVSELKDCFRKYNEVINSTEERYDHLTEEERNKVRDKIKEVTDWLEQQVSGQEQQGKTEDPCLTTVMIKEQMDKLVYIANPVVNKRRPIPKPKKEEEKAEAPPAEGEDAEKAEPKGNGEAAGTETEKPTESSEKAEQQNGMEVD